jgi:HK97 family phage portal protein
MSKFYAARQLLAAGFKSFRFSGYGGDNGSGPGGFARWGGFSRPLPGTDYNFQREAGNLWENSVVLALIKWLTRNYPEAHQVVTRPGADGKPQVLLEHPLLDLLRKPNLWYDRSVLEAGLLLSYVVNGNAYAIRLRSALGKLVGLQYVPHFRLSPYWPKDGSEYITGYVYRVDGETYLFPRDDVLHIRNGLDPLNDRVGLSDLAAVLREVCTDNEAATFSFALLKNMGIPGVIITPKEMGLEPLTPEQRAEFKQRYRESTTGDYRGDAFVHNIPIDVHSPGFSPEQMVLDKTREIPVGRICAAIGIDPMVLGLPSPNKTYANYESAKAAAYDMCLMPLHRVFDMQMTDQLLPETLNTHPKDMLGRDYANVRGLQEDQNERHKRAREDYAKGLIMRSEGKRMINEPTTAADDVYITDLQISVAQIGREENAAEDSPQKTRRRLGALWAQRRRARREREGKAA